MYEYNISVERIIDGDTLDCTIDLGFSISIHERVRLARINAPESRTRDLEEKERGMAATAFLKEVVNALPMESHLLIRTQKDKKGKYGRFLGELIAIYLNDDDEGWSEVNINDLLVSSGHAVYVDY